MNLLSSNNTIDYNLIFNFIEEQKSILLKEQASFNRILSIFVDEFRSSVIQTASVTAFTVTILFSIITLNWIEPSIGQSLIVLAIVISSFIIIAIEYFRNKLLFNKLQISFSYDNSLWTLSELKRNITTQIVTNSNLDYRIFYFFIFCVVCSERVKIKDAWESLLRIKMFKFKKHDFEQFHLSSGDIIKKGQDTLDIFSNQFDKSEYLKELLFLLEPLKNYKINS